MRRILFLAVLVAACSQNPSTRDKAEAAALTAAPSAHYAKQEAADGDDMTRNIADGRRAGEKIIHTGSISLEIDRYADARGEIDKILAEVGGHVARADIHHDDGRATSATLVLRIPQDKWALVVPRVAALGKLRGESTGAEDVTDVHVDLTARLAAARKLEARLLDLTSQAGALADVLAVERELARVRSEIESLDGTLRSLDDRIAFGTLSVSLATKDGVVVAASPSLGGRLDGAVKTSAGAMADAGRAILVAGAAVVPWIPLALILAFFVRRWVRARRTA
jgi:hypothetical protein